MNEINELQNIWKTAAGPAHLNNNKWQTTVKKLKKLERMQNRVNLFKIVVLVICVSSFVYILSVYHNTVAAFAGLGMIIASVVYFMTVYLKNQFNSRKLDFTTDSAAFSENALTLLRKQNAVFKTPFLIFIIGLIAGGNLFVFGMEENQEFDIRFHLFITTFMLTAYYLGYKIRMMRIKKEVTPLIDELMKLKESLKNDGDNT